MKGKHLRGNCAIDSNAAGTSETTDVRKRRPIVESRIPSHTLVKVTV